MSVTQTPRFGFDRPGNESTDSFSLATFLDWIDNVESLGAQFKQGTLAARPAAGVGGRFYRVQSGAGAGVLWYDDGATWQPILKTLRVPHSFTISGGVAVASGDTNYIPPFFVPVPTGQSSTLVAVRHRINSGTSVTCAVQKNGTAVTSLSALTVTPTTATTAATGNNVFADGDQCALVVAAVAGAPKNMTVTCYFDYAA